MDASLWAALTGSWELPSGRSPPAPQPSPRPFQGPVVATTLPTPPILCRSRIQQFSRTGWGSAGQNSKIQILGFNVFLLFHCLQLEEQRRGSWTNANDQLYDTTHILYQRYLTSWYPLRFPDGLGTLPRRLPMRSPSPVDVGRTPQGKSQKEQLKHRHRTVEGYLKSGRKLKLYTVSHEYDYEECIERQSNMSNSFVCSLVLSYFPSWGSWAIPIGFGPCSIRMSM